MKNLFLFILFNLILFPLVGQCFFEHYPLNKVKGGRENQMVIRNMADLNEISQNYHAYSHVNSVSINGKVDINKAISVLYNLVEIYEIKLRNYSGSLRNYGGDTLDLFEDIVYYMTYENSSDLTYIDNFPRLNSLTIVHPGPVVENYKLLLQVKRTKKLNVLGDFFPVDMDSIMHYAAQLKQVTELGLGLDFLTDIKPFVLKMPKLKVLSVFDNASHVNNIEYIDYPMDKRFVSYKEGKKLKQIELRFYSDRSEIEPFDIFYLQHDFPKSEFSKTSQVSKDPKSTINTLNWSLLSKDTIPMIDYASHTHPAADIPIPYLTPTIEYYRIDPTKNNVVHTSAGVELKIIANSITDEYGFVVKEETTIAFADLQDPINVFLAGLQMKARRKGLEVQLNPLSMFEVKAFVKGKPAKLKKGYAMKATFMLPRDTLFSQYILDPVGLKWRPMTGYYYTKKLGEIKYQSFSNWTNPDETDQIYDFDNSMFDARYANPSYFYLMERDYKKQNFEKRKGNKFNSYSTLYYYSESNNSLSIKKGKKLVKIIKQPREEGDAKFLIRFKLEDAYEYHLFSELRAFRKYEFKLDFPEGRREFSKYYTVKKRYFDLRIIYNYGSPKGVIEFKDDHGYRTLDFYVSQEEKESFWKLYQKYSSVMKMHSDEFNRTIAQKEQRYISSYESSRKKEGYKESSATLTEFGIYSNTNTAIIQNKKEFIANFTNDGGIPLDLKRCYVLHKNTNTIYTFPTGNIFFDKNNISAIICLDHTGKVYFIDGDRLSSYHIEDFSYSVIKMELIEIPIKTAEEFKSFIGLK